MGSIETTELGASLRTAEQPGRKTSGSLRGHRHEQREQIFRGAERRVRQDVEPIAQDFSPGSGYRPDDRAGKRCGKSTQP